MKQTQIRTDISQTNLSKLGYEITTRDEEMILKKVRELYSSFSYRITLDDDDDYEDDEDEDLEEEEENDKKNKKSRRWHLF